VPAPQFELLPRRQPAFLLSLAASAFLHGAALEMAPGLLLSIEYWRFRPVEVERMLAQRARSAPLLVRVPEAAAEEKLVFRPVKPKQKALPRQSRQSRAGEPAPAAAAEGAGAAAQASAIVLQPGPRAEPPKKLPPLKAMAVWSGPNPRQVEEPILPGARAPGIEPAPAGTSVSFEAPVPAPPRLPSSLAPSAAMDRARVYLPPSGASPISGRRQWLQEPEVPLSAANPGTPASFIIVTPERPKPGETMTIPPGNLVVLGSGAGGTSSPAPARNGQAAQSAGAAQVAKLERRTPASGSPENGAAAAANASAASSGAKPASREAGPESAASSPAGALAAPEGRRAAAMRVIHTATGDIFAQAEDDGSVTLSYPAGGAFDVVVVDAGLPQAVASHTSALSGSPVYTAYLNVGQPVEWILHYCLPGGETGVRRQHAVVTLSAPKPLKAPYVVEAHLPPEPLWRSSAYQAFYAMLSSSGRLERLRVLQAGGGADALLDSLRRWTFRPALLDGAPAATEVLLVIPPFRP